MHWSIIYFPNQLHNGIRSSFFTSLKLWSSNNICKNYFKSVLSFTLWTWNMALSTCECWSNSTSNWTVFWEKLFRNLNINEMVSLFNRTIKNILSNYIPYETIICDDKDPPWTNNNMNQLVWEKNNTYRSYVLSDKNPKIF